VAVKEKLTVRERRDADGVSDDVQCVSCGWSAPHHGLVTSEYEDESGRSRKLFAQTSADFGSLWILLSHVHRFRRIKALDAFN
jgi:hypothetical protein